MVWAAAQASCLPQDILDFSASINPLGPPQSVRAAVQSGLDQISSYPEPNAWTLREALGQLHQVPADWILVGNGAAELLTWACRSLSVLDRVHIITPAFSDYSRALKAFEAKICTHPIPLALGDLNSAQASTHALLSQSLAELRQLTNSADQVHPLKAGLLLNNPHNPTGQAVLKTELLPLLEQYAQVVVDEAFMEFLPDQSRYSLAGEIERYPNLVVLRSLTKFYSIPGLRLGYVIAHPDWISQWQSWRDPWSVNALALVAGIAALEDEAFQAQTHQWLAAAMPNFYRGLAAISGLDPLPSAANFMLVRCDVSAVKLQQQLLKQRILIRDCISFSELGEGYFRVAVKAEVDNDRLLQALSETLPLLGKGAL